MSSPFAKASDVVFISLVTTVASTCARPYASNNGYIYGEGTVLLLQGIKCEDAKVRRRCEAGAKEETRILPINHITMPLEYAEKHWIDIFEHYKSLSSCLAH